MDLFSDLSPSELELFAGEMELISCSQGRFLIRQEDPGDSLYVILEGQFLVTRRNDRGEEVHLNRVGRGACVGEIALVTGERRSASVRADRDSIVARLGKDAVEHACRTAPQIAAHCRRRTRVEVTGERLLSNVKNLAPTVFLVIVVGATKKQLIIRRKQRCFYGQRGCFGAGQHSAMAAPASPVSLQDRRLRRFSPTGNSRRAKFRATV